VGRINQGRERSGGVLSRLIAQAEAPPVEVPPTGWEVQVNADRNGTLQPGELGIDSMLPLPPPLEFGGPATTRIVKSVLNETGRSSTTIEIALDLRIIEPGVKIREIPFRQRAETGHGRSFECSMSGRAFGSCRHDKLRRTCACQRRHRATPVARARWRASVHMGPCGPRSTPWARQYYEPWWAMFRSPGNYSGAGAAKVSE